MKEDYIPLEGLSSFATCDTVCRFTYIIMFEDDTIMLAVKVMW